MTLGRDCFSHQGDGKDELCGKQQPNGLKLRLKFNVLHVFIDIKVFCKRY